MNHRHNVSLGEISSLSSPPLTTVAVGRAGPEVIRARDLLLLLPVAALEDGPHTPSGKHNRAGPSVGMGDLPPGNESTILGWSTFLLFAFCCIR